MKISTIFKQLLNEEYDSKKLRGQSLLGSTIDYSMSFEEYSAEEKLIGFQLTNGMFIGLLNLPYSEKTGKFSVTKNTSIVYGWTDDRSFDKNELIPWRASSLEMQAEDAIFPNKEELRKFASLLKASDERIDFKASFSQVITKDSKVKERKPLDLEKYSNFTFEFRSDEYKVRKFETRDDSISMTFDNEGESSFDDRSISLHIHYNYNTLGNLEKKPAVSISYYSGWPSEYVDIQTRALDYLIEDIFKQLK